MKLDPTSNPGQYQSITRLGEPLIINAGAGTGKTHTLTTKVAWMMGAGPGVDADPALESVHDPALESIGQLLAITFTNKAASELTGRIRSTLRAEGLHEQALMVDGAWISTIHGMCSRILKAHALELGIDPGFRIANNTDEDAMYAAAFDDLLAAHSDDDAMTELFDEFSGSSQLLMLLRSIIGKGIASSAGLGALEAGPDPLGPWVLLSQLRERLEESISRYAVIPKPGKTVQANIEQLHVAIGKLDDIQQRAPQDFDGSQEGFPELLESLLKISGRVGNNPDAQQATRDVKEVAALTLAELRLRSNHYVLLLMKQLACELVEYVDKHKREHHLLGNDDLLIKLSEVLIRHPEIADEYRERFRLIMVDEFQDTSQIQVDMIMRLLGDDAQICTVGDAQQSIYRFRNADVHVFQDFIGRFKDHQVELSLNYRSHEDILAFSNRIFGQPGVFDGYFLALEPGRPGMDADRFVNRPRIQLIATSTPGKPSVSGQERRRYRAAAIAERFDAMRREEGFEDGDFALLLRAMTEVDIYVEALVAKGFKILVAGGSTFWTSPECQLVGHLLRLLADPYDDRSFYSVFSSQLLKLSAGELAQLKWDAEGRKRPFFDGLVRLDEQDMGPRLAAVRRLL
ncbi:MAG: UvrD-helicase domain-containing protein, partial [Coriobacteriales bacterium]|nr:UvrD-helicase domain-containing protein [Coriobacteriales bacterium]